MFYRLSKRHGFSSCLAVCAVLLASSICLGQQAEAPPKETPAAPKPTYFPQQPYLENALYAKELADAYELYHSAKLDEAEKGFQEILKKSEGGKDVRSEAGAHKGLSAVASRRAKFDNARAEGEQALALFESLHDPRGIADAQEQLGNIALLVADDKSARGYFNKALKEYEAEGMLREKARLLVSLANATDGYPERIKIDTQALELATQLGDKRTQGQALHGIGQWLLHDGDFEGAEEKLKQAEAVLDSPDDRMYLGRVLLTEGRLYRAHDEMDRAIEMHRRALEIADAAGDNQGRIAILNALGACYGDQQKYRQALEVFQRAYELVKDTNSPRTANTLLRNIAESYVYLGEYQRGADIIEEMNRQTPDLFPYGAQYRYAVLALAYQRLKEYDRALRAATKSVEEARANKNQQFLSEPLMEKAHAEEKLGQSEAALADVYESLRVIEELRAHLVAIDFMKRGFAEKTQEAFAFSVELLQSMNQPAQAIEVAEKARSRAFLDLLATRQVQNRKSSGEALVAEKKSAPPLPPSEAASAQSQVSADGTPQLTQRGGKTAGPPSHAAPADPELPSVVSTESSSLKEMQEQARRLHSTILSYWVSEESTIVWVLDSGDAVHSARIPLQREHLAELVRGVWPLDGHAEPATKAETAGARNSRDSDPDHSTAVEFPSRGQAELKADRTQKDRWRELYQLLIEPVEAYLPSQPGSRITIIPHGPLFALPFAGLRDARGRYFLERYTLEYAPAISVLRFTGANAAHVEGAVSHFLLVADPAGMQKLGLPQLPGSRREVSDVARRFPVNEVTVLVGAEAQGDTVREKAAKSTVIHFATHGIVDDTQPFDSYLALSDGKLTARDIYGLNLNADLVFLSACRSGMGKVTGDGVLGLTRAFLYAGARSVVATLWDVADEPTAKLVANFYKNMGQHQDKAQALRAAQLSVLSELRAGKLQVATRRGPLTLPENPVFWASFVLIGEP